MDPESTGSRTSSAQFETLSLTFRRHLADFLREIGDPVKLEDARSRTSPPQENWWWRPEDLLAEERKQSANKLLRGVGIAAGILALLIILYQLFLQPDPSVIAVMDTRREAELMVLEDGDPQAGLVRVEQGLKAVPGDGELLTYKGCLLTLIGGREKDAEEAFAAAEKALGKREYMLILSAQTYSILAQPALAQARAEEAIALNPKSAQAYLIYGQALEDQKDANGAYQAYETASNLGMENDDPTITAQARMKMGILLQSMNLFPQEDLAYPSPTP
jgi:tetratricopeptide (TPR) repeat protein